MKNHSTRALIAFLLLVLVACGTTHQTSAVNKNLEEFFAKSVVQEIGLEIDAADRQAMFDALPERIYVPATFNWGDIRLENVGVYPLKLIEVQYGDYIGEDDIVRLQDDFGRK